MRVISTAMSRSRTVLLSLAVLLVAGLIAYLSIPKEAEPDIEIPKRPEGAEAGASRPERPRGEGRRGQGPQRGEGSGER